MCVRLVEECVDEIYISQFFRIINDVIRDASVCFHLHLICFKVCWVLTYDVQWDNPFLAQLNCCHRVKFSVREMISRVLQSHRNQAQEMAT